MSDLRPTTIERAFQIARTGEVTTLEEIAYRLQREGYLEVNYQLNGRLIRKQLRDILRASQSLPTPSAADAFARNESV